MQAILNCKPRYLSKYAESLQIQMYEFKLVINVYE